ncbi:MAG TPA: plasmid stability protein stbC, partial [Pusillimonas sp.]|nr:plasmid stability protein stbC [Pusillimonas sp.]
SLLASIAREAGGLTDAEVESMNQLRDKTPAEPMRFE